ncbi:hypothetical protein C0J52_21529 [Blattella germanica]|nr:hypothetical protein C0J52_21529 [Blattella germanica]
MLMSFSQNYKISEKKKETMNRAWFCIFLYYLEYNSQNESNRLFMFLEPNHPLGCEILASLPYSLNPSGKFAVHAYAGCNVVVVRSGKTESGFGCKINTTKNIKFKKKTLLTVKHPISFILLLPFIKTPLFVSSQSFCCLQQTECINRPTLMQLKPDLTADIKRNLIMLMSFSQNYKISEKKEETMNRVNYVDMLSRHGFVISYTTWNTD